MVKVLKNKRAKGNGMKMKYNFDEVIDRYDTNSVKYENAKEEEPDLKDDFTAVDCRHGFCMSSRE